MHVDPIFASGDRGARATYSWAMAAAQHRGQGSVLGLAWNKYLQQLQQKPLRTKALTSACIAGLSDVIAQRIIKGHFSTDHNWRRTLAIVFYGFLWNGPSAHFWQKLMEWLFKGKSDMATVLKKASSS